MFSTSSNLTRLIFKTYYENSICCFTDIQKYSLFLSVCEIFWWCNTILVVEALCLQLKAWLFLVTSCFTYSRTPHNWSYFLWHKGVRINHISYNPSFYSINCMAFEIWCTWNDLLLLCVRALNPRAYILWNGIFQFALFILMFSQGENFCQFFKVLSTDHPVKKLL